MSIPKVACIINFCSNEQMFLGAQIAECAKFADVIIVSYGSHLYDGTEEDPFFFDSLKIQYPNAVFVKYDVDVNKDLSKMPGVVRRHRAYWHNLARWSAIAHLPHDIEWVFVLDADEIPEGRHVKNWLESSYLSNDTLYKLANYWYFKFPHFQATQHEDSILFIQKKYLTFGNVFHDDERDGIIKQSALPQVRMVYGLNGMPMFHHFSFVRSRQGLEKKLKTWAHCEDIFKGINVSDVVNYVYNNNNVNDFVHNYLYKIVPNMFNIDVSH